MAYLLGEITGRSYGADLRTRTGKRKFKVRAQLKTEDGPDVIAAVGIAYGDAHPKNPFLYATDFQATQDSKTWYLWIVEVSYETPEREDADTNPDDNPLLREPQISYDTETIMVAALGEVDNTGTVTKAVVTSAGEPYDPPPEEELDILMISITRWETPFFSLTQYRQFQNAVNDASFTFGDLTIAEGEAKLRIRIGPVESKMLLDDSGKLYYRQVDYVIAVNDLGWDLSALDWGTYYVDGSGNKINFKDDPDEGTEFGLLDGAGGKKLPAADEFFNTWKNKKRADFSVLSLPSGP